VGGLKARVRKRFPYFHPDNNGPWDQNEAAGLAIYSAYRNGNRVCLPWLPGFFKGKLEEIDNPEKWLSLAQAVEKLGEGLY